MPSKAKPIQMKTTYHVGGDTRAVPKPVDIKAANARYTFNAANKSAVNAANKSTPTAVSTPTADTRKFPKSTLNRRRPSSRRLQQMQRRKLAMMGRRGGGRVSPAATPTPRNMAVRGPKRATGSRRRLGKKLSRFMF